MRKRIICILLSLVMIAFAGCDRNKMTKMDVDDAVTVEQLNTSSALVVRGFFESDMFEKCFPEEFINGLKEDNIDMFAQYSQSLAMPGEFAGTQYLNYNELSAEGGYDDWEVFRNGISEIQGIPADQIEAMQIVQIKVYFVNDGENQYIEIYSIAYEYGGSWYMYEIQNSNAEFDEK